MRVVAHGNLTVELIRAQRFDVACQDQLNDPNQRCRPCQNDEQSQLENRNDRVELSPQVLANDPWAIDLKRAHATIQPVMASRLDESLEQRPDEPKPLSPVIGSPALAGLGAAWVVPGTLLDVVA